MRVYLAAAYERHAEMQGVRDILTAFGHEITSRWIDRAEKSPRETAGALSSNRPDLPQEARLDLADVDNAEAIILFTGGGRGGYHTEYGFALGRGKYLIVVGDREHVFHTLAAEWYRDWTGLIGAVTGRPPASALYFLHPDPAHATDEIPLVIENGAPADPGPQTAWWPFTPSDAEATLPGDEDATVIARKLRVKQAGD